MHYLIGIDIGTQGTKGKLFDESLNTISEAFEPSRLISPEPGTTWQEPEELLKSVIYVIKKLTQTEGVNPGRISAVGIDAQMAGIMGIDKNADAVTVYDSWLDTRCGKYVDQMRNTAGVRITGITGGPVTYTHGPKILWWKHEHPEVYKKIAKFVLPHTYVVGKLTGGKAEDAYLDYTCIQYSGFGDNKNKVWSGELLDMFGVDKEKMPRIISPFEIVGKITGEYASLCGLKEGTPVAAGAGDTAASIFGAGMFGKDKVLDCAGTASALCCVVDEYVPDTQNQTLTMMRSPVDGYWFPLAYINGGGLCIRWFRDEFTGRPAGTYEELEREAGKVDPGSEGVLFVPHFAGRVLPNNPDLRGSFIGLNWNHGRGHLYRSVMEGIAYEYDFYMKIIRSLYPERNFQTAYAIGGGAKSDLFLKIKADVLGVDMVPLIAGDTALVGSSVIAGVGCGLFSDYKKPLEGSIKLKEAVSWDCLAHERYKTYAEDYLKMIDGLTEIYRKCKF